MAKNRTSDEPEPNAVKAEPAPKAARKAADGSAEMACDVIVGALKAGKVRLEQLAPNEAGTRCLWRTHSFRAGTNEGFAAFAEELVDLAEDGALAFVDIPGASKKGRVAVALDEGGISRHLLKVAVVRS